MAEGKTESAVAVGTACVADLAQLAEDDPLRVEALRRWAYVQRIVATQGLRWEAAQLEAMIADVSAALGDEQPPAWHSLRRWVRAYNGYSRHMCKNRT